MLKITNLTRIAKFDEIEQLLQWLATRLNITSGEVVLVHNDKILNKFSNNDLKINALLYETPFRGVYNLIIDSKISNPDLILCHEMVHLSQYIKGYLKLDMDNKIFTWKGAKYDNSLPYDLRPWEREAYSQQGKLYREYKKYKRQMERELKNQNRTKNVLVFKFYFCIFV